MYQTRVGGSRHGSSTTTRHCCSNANALSEYGLSLVQTIEDYKTPEEWLQDFEYWDFSIACIEIDTIQGNAFYQELVDANLVV